MAATLSVLECRWLSHCHVIDMMTAVTMVTMTLFREDELRYADADAPGGQVRAAAAVR